jgi:hypothetical protein
MLKGVAGLEKGLDRQGTSLETEVDGVEISEQETVNTS